MADNRDWLLPKGAPAGEGTGAAPDRLPEFSLNIVRENGNEEGVLYGLMMSAPYFDPSRGVQFVFEGWHIGRWDEPQSGAFLVSITGHNLHDIVDRLKACQLKVVRLGGNVAGCSVRRLARNPG